MVAGSLSISEMVARRDTLLLWERRLQLGTRHMKKRSEWLKKNPTPSGVQSTKRSETAAANSYWRLMSYKKRPTRTSVCFCVFLEDKSLE
jgi:hypothetical protein